MTSSPAFRRPSLRRILDRMGFRKPCPFSRVDPASFSSEWKKTDFAGRKRWFLAKERPRILYNTSWSGGVGGLERSTQAFVRYFQEQGCEIDLVYEATRPSGPYPIEEKKGTRLLSLGEFRQLEVLPDYDLFYSEPTPTFEPAFWKNRLRGFCGITVLNWQKYTPYWIKKNAFAFDLIHSECLPPCSLPSFAFVSSPPMPRLKQVAGSPPSLPFQSYYLTAFNPYGKVKGLSFLEENLPLLDRPLVWCYDLRSFSSNSTRINAMRQDVARLRNPLLFPVEAPSQKELHQLYRDCGGYICFSEYESYGWSILDAILHNKPVAARNVGLLRETKGFQPWEGTCPPVFNRISGPLYTSDFLDSLRNRLLRSRIRSSFRFEARRHQPS